MNIHFTDIVVQRLRADKQTTFWDEAQPGFGLRVGARTKTWIVMHGKDRVRRTIGHYPKLTLAEARKEARKYLAALPDDTGEPVYRFDATLDLFLDFKRQRTRPKTAYDTERQLKRHLLPKLGSKPLREIKRAEVVSVLDKLLVTTPSEANHAFTAARQFFRWVDNRGYGHNPISGVQPPAKNTPRDRVLNDEELVAIWWAAEQQGYPYGTITQLLILLGQRKGETKALQRDWIDTERRLITFPASITKNARRHTIPYGERAARVLATVPKFNSPLLLFPGRDKSSPIEGWGKAKEEIDKQLELPHWTYHDLRRSFTTNMAELGIAPHVCEKLLNHVSGTISGVAAIYNRYGYAKEMRDAIGAWEDRLMDLLAVNRRIAA